MKRFLFSAFTISFAIWGLLHASSCANREPLNEEELQEVTDKLLEGIMNGKLTAYKDDRAMLAVSPNEILLSDGNGSYKKPNIQSFSILTEQEISLAAGNFEDTSTAIGMIAPITTIEVGNSEIPSQLCYLKPKDVRKTIGGSLGRRFIYHLQQHFEKNREYYNGEIKEMQEQEIIKSIYSLLYKGDVAAYETENMTKVLSPNQLEMHMSKKEVVEIPDPQFPNEFKDTIITSPIKAGDITHVRPYVREDNSLLGITLMTEIREYDVNQQAYRVLPAMPWVFVSNEELETALSPIQFKTLQEITAVPETAEDENPQNTEDSLAS